MGRVTAVTLAVVLALAGCSDSGSSDQQAESASGADGSSSTVTTVAQEGESVAFELGEVPLWPDPAIVPEPAALDALAAQYVAATGERNAEEFLFGWLPARAFDAIFSGDAPDPATTLWLFWASGYLGGVWLRSELDAANPNSAVGSINTPPSEEGFRAMAADAQRALDAGAAGGDELFAYLDAALWPSDTPGGNGFVSGLVENFGYNQGYLLQILEQPPEGLATPEAFAITCDGPIACDYASPKVEALPGLVRDSAGAVARLAARIEAVQAGAVERGRMVWSSGLSVQGFPQAAYETLLDVSSSYLETVHATTLAAIGAIDRRDTALGTSAALANAAMNVWLTGYTTGLLEGAPYTPPVFG